MGDVKNFKVIGLAANEQFQKCVEYIEFIAKKYPRKYGTPYIRPMLEFDWMEYLIKTQRNLGGELWCVNKPFVVFVDNDFLGDDEDLMKFLATSKMGIQLKRDYFCLAKLGVYKLYEREFRIGLYKDLVPKTCKNFIKKCTSKHGYQGRSVHRIVKNSWIQFGGFSMPTKSKSCENYIVPHSRRGVLSMCNNGAHKDNTTQFFVTLNPTPWMDYKYVAFGQLVQGESVLRQLENWSTSNEYPDPDKLRIANCGEISFDDDIDVKQKNKINKFFFKNTIDNDVADAREVPSILLESNYKNGMYWFDQDEKSGFPLENLPSYLMDLSKYTYEEVENEEGSTKMYSRSSSSGSIYRKHYELHEQEDEQEREDDVSEIDEVVENLNVNYEAYLRDELDFGG